MTVTENILVSLFLIFITSLITFHITRFKDKKRERLIVDKNIKKIIEHQNIIVRALANSNGFGEKFNKAYEDEQTRMHHDLTLDKNGYS